MVASFRTWKNVAKTQAIKERRGKNAKLNQWINSLWTLDVANPDGIIISIDAFKLAIILPRRHHMGFISISITTKISGRGSKRIISGRDSTRTASRWAWRI